MAVAGKGVLVGAGKGAFVLVFTGVEVGDGGMGVE
jgi:hypothetical protein